MTPTVLFLATAVQTITDRCIEWPWSPGGTGYAQVRYAGRTRKASHVVLALSGRPRPAAPANLALHSCDNPMCCNPAHLRWGTSKQNSEDAVARNRIRPTRARGERSGNARLTDADVRRLRRLAAAGQSQRAVARTVGLPRSTVQAVLTGQSWSHV